MRVKKELVGIISHEDTKLRWFLLEIGLRPELWLQPHIVFELWNTGRKYSIEAYNDNVKRNSENRILEYVIEKDRWERIGNAV